MVRKKERQRYGKGRSEKKTTKEGVGEDETGEPMSGGSERKRKEKERKKKTGSWRSEKEERL